MAQPSTTGRARWDGSQGGFSLIELMVVLAILLTVSATVMTLMFHMTMTQGSITNRTEMHSSVRSATEILQQEISQAGRATLPTQNSYTLTGTGISCTPPPPALPGTYLVCGAGTSATLTVIPDVAEFFVGEKVRIGPDASDPEAKTETVQLTGVDTSANTITAVFQDAHAAGAAVSVVGGFAAGIVPFYTASNTAKFLRMSGSSAVVETVTSGTGSTGSVLKLFGDINDDGKMVLIKYVCTQSTDGSGTLTRQMIPLDPVPNPIPAAVTLLEHLYYNENPASPGSFANRLPCFNYQMKSVGANDSYVVNIAVTVSTQTQFRDPQTGAYQYETKALLNVSPRNVFQAWQMATEGIMSRVQPMPENVWSNL